MKNLDIKDKPISAQVSNANDELHKIWCEKIGVLYDKLFNNEISTHRYNFEILDILQPLKDLFDLDITGDNHIKNNSHLYLFDKEKKIELGRIVYNKPTNLFNGEAIFIEREYKFDGLKRGASELYGTAITGLRMVMDHYTNYNRYTKEQLLKLEKYIFEET